MDQHHPQQDSSPCQLLVALHELWVLPPQYISCEPLKGQIPLTNPSGVTPIISIIMMYTFYQSVYYASHNPSVPSNSEENMLFGLVWQTCR